MLEFLQLLAKMQKPGQNLRDELLKGIRALGEQNRLSVQERPNGWIAKDGESAAIEVQFGGRRDFYQMIEMLEKEAVDFRVVVTSSNVKSMTIGEIKWILNNKYQTKNRWLILDIEHKESPKTVNFMLYGGTPEEKSGTGRNARETLGDMAHVTHGNRERRESKAPRRKKIYGVRGEHKEQD